MATKKISIRENKLIIQYDDDLESQANWLLEVVEKLFMESAPVDGEVINSGWFSLILEQQSNRDFLIYTPDLQKNPFIDTTLDLSDALYVHAFQLDFARKQGVTPLFTSFRNTLVCVKGCFSEKNLFMTRTSPNENDSGWFIGLKDANPNMDQTDYNNLESIYAFQLLALRPELLEVLYLPPDYIVSVNENGVEFAQSIEKSIEPD